MHRRTELFRSDALRRHGYSVREATYAEDWESILKVRLPISSHSPSIILPTFSPITLKFRTSENSAAPDGRRWA